MVECTKISEITELKTRQKSFDMAIQEIKDDIKNIYKDQHSMLSKVEHVLDTKADKSEVEDIKSLVIKFVFMVMAILVGIIGFLLTQTFW